MQIKRMKIYSLYNPKPKTNLGETSNKNFLGNGLVKPMYKCESQLLRLAAKSMSLRSTMRQSIILFMGINSVRS